MSYRTANIFSFRLTVVFLFITTVMLLSTDAYARKKDETKATGAIDAKTFEILTKAQELTEADQYDEAVRTLDTIKNSVSRPFSAASLPSRSNRRDSTTGATSSMYGLS